MTDTLAEGIIKVGLHDEGAIAELRALDKEFDRTMRSMDGKEAEVRITGNLRDLKRALKEADALEEAHQKKVADLQKQYAEETSRGRKSAITKQIRQEEQALKAIRDQT